MQSPVLCMKCFWFPIFWPHICTRTLHTQNNIGRAITMSLDLFMKSWFVAMARQIIIGAQLILFLFVQYWCSLRWNVVVTLYSDLTLKVIIKVFPQKNNTIYWPCWHLESFFRSTSTNKVLLTETLNLKTFSWMLMVRAKNKIETLSVIMNPIKA